MHNVSATGRRRGFTLLELMIAMVIIAILAGIAVPIYSTMILSSREKRLKYELQAMRRIIDEYSADKKKAPQTLQDFVDAGYYRKIPVDPITDSDASWEIVFDNAVSSPDQTETGISDVRSGSNRISSEGTPYNTW